jgi:hypothetical protein
MGDDAKKEGTSGEASGSGEAIGRPPEWREGRYERAGKPVEPSVLRKPGEDSAAPDTPSTPVTREDYEGR